MSLWPISITTGIFPYLLYDGRELDPIWEIYNHSLITPPRLYEEAINSISSFFYEPGNDCLVAYATTIQVNWPGWGAYRYEWNAETGEFISRTWCGISSIAYAKAVAMGSYGKFFCLSPSDFYIREVPWNTLAWVSPMWKSSSTWGWSPQRNFSNVIVNLQDNLVVGMNGTLLESWDISGTPTLRSSLRAPTYLGYMAYESRDICWIVTMDGFVLKCNYRNNPIRWEMLSKVQNPSEDAINYFCAWDQKRSRIVVLRQRPDAVDGSSQSQFEFYLPLIKLTAITDPVPVKRHRSNDIVEFVTHLYGDAGEGLTSYRILAELQVPSKGFLLKSEVTTAVNGSASILYQAPDETGDETLLLTVNVNDGVV